jgi:hypothetical protein
MGLDGADPGPGNASDICLTIAVSNIFRIFDIFGCNKDWTVTIYKH